MYQLKATKPAYRKLVGIYTKIPTSLKELDFFADKLQQSCELRWQDDKYRYAARLRYLDGVCALVYSRFEGGKSSSWREVERTVFRPGLLELRELELVKEYQ